MTAVEEAAVENGRRWRFAWLSRDLGSFDGFLV